jgi:hypothetical protein
MKHAKPSPNKKRIAAAALAVGTTGSIPIVFAGPANAAPTTAPAGGDVTTPATPTACEDYIVNRGDNLSTIAARYGVALADLEAINPGIIAGDRPDDYSLIFRGGHVHLPDGHCTPAGTVPVPPVGRHDGGHGHHVKVWYRDCTDAPAGLHRGQPGYRHALDMDGDGKACEGPWPPAPPVVTPPVDNPPPVIPPVVTPPSGGSLITPVIAPDCPGTNSGYCAHPVAFWAPLIQQAQQLVGGNVANASVQDIEGLMLAESSGNPNAINNYDINAQNGTPSKGLMQVIQPTFDVYHVAGTSLNLYDPLANIAAALAYINDQYGGNIPGSPY